MQAWNVSEALGIGRYEPSQGYTTREVAAAVVWADYEGYTWSQLRSRNAKVLYRSVRRMGSETAPGKRLSKLGNHNVLVNCFMATLQGVIQEDTSKGVGAGRQMEVNKCLRGNVASGVQKNKVEGG